MIEGARELRSPRARAGGPLLAVLLTLLIPSSTTATEFDFPDFTNPGGLSLLGNATIAGSFLQLTAAANNQVGACWYDTPVPVSSGFTTTFEFQISPVSGGADGMAFLIQANGPNVIYTGGGSLGYDGIPASVTIELDHYPNGNFSDPNGNHISIHTGFGGPTGTDESQSIGIVTTIPNLGGIHTLTVEYDGVLSVYLDGGTTPVLSVNVDLAPIVGGETATVGFTGATGGLSEQHLVRSWSFSSAGDIVRGDANADGFLSIDDALAVLGHLFVPPYDAAPCADAGDANDDGALQVADAITILGELFQPGFPPLPAPSVACGPDPTDDPLGCTVGFCP